MQDDTPVQWFSRLYSQLRGHRPYEWVSGLFESLINGNPPQFLYYPTGSGKTEIIPTWLLSLLWQEKEAVRRTVPLRLQFCIDRRKVVDQAEEEAAKISGHLDDHEEMAQLLQGMGVRADGQPLLPVAIRRGERIEGWEEIIKNPSVPAIVCGTPDMLASPLVFLPYGVSRRQAIPHCGMAMDSLFVVDEAHLSSVAYRALTNTQAMASKGLGIPFWVVGMSGTPRSGQASGPCSLSEIDRRNMKGYHAKKQAKLEAVHHDKDGNLHVETAEKVISLVQQSPERLVIVYVTSPDTAMAIHGPLNDGDEVEVAVMTGIQRGLEREEVDRKLDAFRNPYSDRYMEPDGKRHVLVCTAAGELGLDISGELLISDLPSLDQLIQRLGRLARWGGAGNAVIIHEDWDGLEPCECALKMPENRQKAKVIEETARAVIVKVCGIESKDIRRKGKGVLSFRTCSDTMDRLDLRLREKLNNAYVGLKNIQGTEDAALKFLMERASEEKTLQVGVPDTLAWNGMPGYQEGLSKVSKHELVNASLVEQSFLLGDASGIPASIYIRGLDVEDNLKMVVRRETPLLVGMGDEGLREYLDRVPVLHHEVFKAKVDRKLVEFVREAVGRGRAILISVTEGKIGAGMLGGSEEPYDLLRGGMLYLSEEEARQHLTRTGHFREGLVEEDERATFLDVFEHPEDPKRNEKGWHRAKATEGEDCYFVESLSDPVSQPTSVKDIREWCPVGFRYMDFSMGAATPETSLWVRRKEERRESSDLPLSSHLGKAEACVRELLSSFSFAERVEGSLLQAARRHDTGKGHWKWMKAAGVKGEPMARLRRYKAGMGMALEGLRHELVSALDFPEGDDLGLWLVANHHGFARPCFGEKAYDPDRPEESSQINQKVSEALCRLLIRYSPWELAWLAALLRAADMAGD